MAKKQQELDIIDGALHGVLHTNMDDLDDGSILIAEKFSCIAQELVTANDKIGQYSDEIDSLRSERQNMSMLLEHLENLVSRHEKSLRNTVVRRHSNSPAVSSEIEIMKALQTLYQHHKTMDEKLHQKLALATEKANQTDVKLLRARKEIVKLRKCLKEIAKRNGESFEKLINTDNGLNSTSSLTNGDVGLSYANLDLNFDLDKCKNELQEVREERDMLKTKLLTCEQQNTVTQGELFKTDEVIIDLQQKLEETFAQKEDLEVRITTLEDRCCETQRDLDNTTSANQFLSDELTCKEESQKEMEELLHEYKEKYMAKEKELKDTIKNAEIIPDLENQLQDTLKELSKANENQKAMRNRIVDLETKIQDHEAELLRARKRQKVSEDDNMRLSRTLDKMLSETNQRLQIHLEERMTALETKNGLNQELQRVRELLDERTYEKKMVQLQLERTKRELISAEEKVININIEDRVSPRSTTALTNGRDSMSHDDILLSSSLAITGSSELSKSFGKIDDHNGRGKLTSEGSSSTTSDKDTGTAKSIMENNPKMENNINNKLLNLKIESPESKEMENRSSGSSPLEENELTSQEQELKDTLDRVKLLQKRVANRCEDQYTIEKASYLPLSQRIATQMPLARNDDQLLWEAEILTTELERVTRNYQLPSKFQYPTMNELGENCEHFTSSIDNGSDKADSPLPSPPKVSTEWHKQDSFLQRLEGNLGSKANSQFTSRDSQASNASTTISDNNSSRPKLNRDDEVDIGEYTVSGSSEISEDKEYKLNHTESNSTSSPHSNSIDRKSSIKHGQNRLRNSFRKLLGIKPKDDSSSTTDGKISMDSQSTISESQGSTTQAKTKSQLLQEVRSQGVPFDHWDALTVIAWLELWACLPAWFVAMCKNHVQSGADLNEMTSDRLKKDVGITHPLHRLKLMLAVDEIVKVMTPGSNFLPTSITFGSLNYDWTASEWLSHVGLTQYKEKFLGCLIDARMMEHLSRKDWKTYIKVLDTFHYRSLQYALLCLKEYKYDWRKLVKKHKENQHTDQELLIWSNARVIKWVCDIGLEKYAYNLLQTGINGAVLALDSKFTTAVFAQKLKIPNHGLQAYGRLHLQFEALMAVKGNKLSIDQLSASMDKGENEPKFKRGLSWRHSLKMKKANDSL
ncbi:uncharacterized protein TRIADDRAFT_51625 [Trichoplax adhaerens]|uniref:SAM domain-containing protein n=1 Tax=Trichoplax adhaerens TaxID=10228 RepID=B3RK50_TRIAD|nr:hypothetical protein TRIADDRAFT_51625 [Trichoplax adhaerens]EDV29378.1 hypothetical protein TRIADDRAFT_51625 [Trichoplax adhaerens]|eukprot:XP_002108580.1 hypothetical protein TRIADDRAFT_51625 [Trichoplax adhaerens]